MSMTDTVIRNAKPGGYANGFEAVAREWAAMEKDLPNAHAQEVSPLKRVLLRTLPELAAELDSVVNVFDPWARDRGRYYSLRWKPRLVAERDEAF
ncbi:MAG: hypothetical protein ACHBMF_03270 [Chromatiales bacterium]